MFGSKIRKTVAVRRVKLIHSNSLTGLNTSNSYKVNLPVLETHYFILPKDVDKFLAFYIIISEYIYIYYYISLIDTSSFELTIPDVSILK